MRKPKIKRIHDMPQSHNLSLNSLIAKLLYLHRGGELDSVRIFFIEK